MDFISNQKDQIESMLKDLQLTSLDELFLSIPKEIRLAAIEKDDGLSEMEGLELIRSIGSKNSSHLYKSYLGGGAYGHYVPALVPFIILKSEFLTSYTPYQAEASQGMLQAIYEYQSAICALTGMEAANASVYDAASACAEAVLMTLRINSERNRVILFKSLNPRYDAALRQYLSNQPVEIIEAPLLENKTVDLAAYEKLLSENTASVLFQSPNYYGFLEESEAIIEAAHKKGALAALASNPLSYGIYKDAGHLGADIAVGDTQPFGIPLQFGGPYSGYMACKHDFLRQLPGRIVGETVDSEGKRGFCLTLQTREQHIRRAKATSNICTNQALAALSSLVAILWYGKEGVKKLALDNFQRASFLRENLKKLPHVTVYEGAIFNEFTVRFSQSQDHVLKHFMKKGILPGVFCGNSECIVAVTETKSKEDLESYIQAAKEL